MLRPPQPAVYVFCLDVSRAAVETGYLKVFCDILQDELEKLPGDSRTQVGFITYDRVCHFYSLPDGATQPTQLTVCDIDDMFLPSPSDLLVNLNECRGLVHQLLEELPSMFKDTNETQSAVGAALQAAYKIPQAPTANGLKLCFGFNNPGQQCSYTPQAGGSACKGPRGTTFAHACSNWIQSKNRYCLQAGHGKRDCRNK